MSPSSALGLIGCTQRSKRDERGSDHRDGHRVERALEDRLDAAGVVDLQRGPLRAEAGAERVDVGGRRGRLAEDRHARALALEPGGLQRRDPVGGQDLVGVQAAAGAERGGERARARTRTPACRSASASRRAADHGGRRAAPGAELQAHPGDRVDVALDPGRELRGVHRQRHLRARAGLVDLPLGPEHLLGLADADRRAHAQVGDVDLRRDPVGLERVHDRVALGRGGAVLARQRRQRRVLAVGRRRRVARRLDRALQARLVRDQAELQRELEARGRRAHVLVALVRDRPVVDRGGHGRGRAGEHGQHARGRRQGAGSGIAALTHGPIRDSRPHPNRG